MDYQVEDCVHWITKNEFHSIAVQLDSQSTGISIGLILTLQSALPSVKFSLIVSDSCSIDLLAVQHLGKGKVDGLIKFGVTCLAPIPRCLDDLPVLFIFGNNVQLNQWEYAFGAINKLRSDRSDRSDPSDNSKWLLLYNTDYLELAVRLTKHLEWLEIAKLINFSFNWDFVEDHKDLIYKDVNATCPDFGPFWTPQSLHNYSKIIYIGSQPNLHLRLEKSLTIVDPERQLTVPYRGQRELSKRIGSIERLKAKKSVNLGLLFTNSFPIIDECLERIEMIKKRNHTVNKIMLIHSTDECKLGNFPNLDAYVLINSCKCTKLIEKLDLHLPVLTFTEYEILCGCRVTYGGAEWNQEEITVDETCDDDGKLPPVTNNQLIESEVLDKDKWYGLTINPGYQPLSYVKQGQSGKASGYSNEPI